VRLHKALDAAKVSKELHTVPGADHGGYTVRTEPESLGGRAAVSTGARERIGQRNKSEIELTAPNLR